MPEFSVLKVYAPSQVLLEVTMRAHSFVLLLASRRLGGDELPRGTYFKSCGPGRLREHPVTVLVKTFGDLEPAVPRAFRWRAGGWAVVRLALLAQGTPSTAGERT
jgi:hypothetical protein